MAKTAKKTASATKKVSEALRTAIVDSGRTYYDLGKESGVQQNMIGRFVRGERDLRMASADKLATVLKLKLVPE